MSQYLVIIPTYNEMDNVELMVRKVFSLDKPFHLLIVDDGSPAVLPMLPPCGRFLVKRWLDRRLRK